MKYKLHQTAPRNEQLLWRNVSFRSMLLVIFISLSLRGSAATYISSGTGGDWSSPATWGGTGVPQSIDDVFISHGTIVIVSGNYTCNNLTIGDANSSAAIITVSANNSLTVNGNCNINPNSMNGIYILNSVEGTINVFGTLSFSSRGTSIIGTTKGTLNFALRLLNERSGIGAGKSSVMICTMRTLCYALHIQSCLLFKC